ncbi:DUF1937 family protein [Borborobacter arsenicus]|nr:DUF1937 family protein [Pseudaminobacter arsenicus]
MRTYPGGGYTGTPPVNGGTLYDHPRNVPKLHWDSVARSYVEHDTEHMEMFGEIVATADVEVDADGTRHIVAVNDNLPVARQQARDDEKWRSTVGFRLKCLPLGITYLGSPYSLYKHGLHRAAREAAMAAARLMEIGLVVYAPIPHGHSIACWGDLPAEWEFWKRQCQPYIDAASSLVVLKLDGWQDSVGLTYEIECFEEAGKPIVMVTMDEVLGLRGEGKRSAA